MPRRPLITAAVLTVVAAAARAGEPGEAEAPRPAEALERILRKELADPLHAGREIAALGPEVGDALLLLLEDGDEHEAELLAGVRLLGIAAFADELQRRAEDGTTAEREVGLTVLAETGNGSHIPLALALAALDADGAKERGRALHGTLRTLLVAKNGFGVSRELLSRCSDAEGRALVDAVGADADTRSLDWLAFQIDAGVDLLPLLLSHVAAMAPRVVVPPFARVRTTARGLLSSEDEQIARLAVLAVGGLRDADASQLLVELTLDERANIRDSAFHALRSISGLALPSDSDAWATRLAEEEAWRSERLPALLADLHSVNRRAAIHAVSDLVQHAWWRDELTLELVPVLDRDDAPELQRVTIEAIAALGSPFGACPLFALLEDERLGEVAAAGLQKLTGLPHAGEDLEAWTAALPCGDDDVR